MSHDECGLEQSKEVKKDLYWYLQRATDRVNAWSPERRAQINYAILHPAEPTDHADTFDRVL